MSIVFQLYGTASVKFDQSIDRVIPRATTGHAVSICNEGKKTTDWRGWACACVSSGLALVELYSRALELRNDTGSTIYMDDLTGNATG
jgi:hypothetical protein